jgi:TPR repeat protein
MVSNGYVTMNSSKYKTLSMLLLPAAEAGNSSAQTHLGHMFYCGSKVQRDFQKAFKWSQKGLFVP